MVEVAPELVKKDGDTVTRSAFAHPNGASYIAWLFQGGDLAVRWRLLRPRFHHPHQRAEGGRRRRVLPLVGRGWLGHDAGRPDSDFYNGLTASMMASTGGLRGIIDEVGDKFDVRHRVPAEGGGRSAAAPAAPVWRCWPARPPEKQEAAFKYIAFATSPEITTYWSQNTGYMPVRKSAIASEEMQEFFAENPNFKTAVDQLPMTRPQDSARVFIPNGDQIIGKGLERITINQDDPQPVFDEVAATLTEEAQPVLEAIAALG